MPFPTIATESETSNSVVAPNLSQFTRGNEAFFEVDFFDDAPSNTSPAVPANPATDPSWAILDPSGVQVTTGVGTAGSAPGRWQAKWHVPPDAALSTQSNKWRIVWNIVTQTSRQLQQTVPFDIIDLRTPNTLEDVRAHATMAYAGQSQRLVVRFEERPLELSVTGFPAVGLTSPVPSDTAAFTGSLADSAITEVQEQNLFAYIFDTPALTAFGDYQIVWNSRQTITAPTDTEVQRLVVPPPVFWSLAPSLKILIDKLQKKQGTIQAYHESDLYEYFAKGMGILNGVTPISNWDLCTFPYSSSTTRFLVEAAALWAMRSQHILSGELRFSFSGQLVTLDLDQTDLYSEVAQLLLESVTGDGKGSWPNTKMNLSRATTPIAHVGNRFSTAYGATQFTFKVHSSEVASGPGPLFGNGLYPAGFINTGFTLTDSLIYLRLV